MTGSTSGPRVPGTTLLKLARLLFSEQLLSAVIQPTISDLQREVAVAGQNRLKRLRARWRGYLAFWRLALIAPFVSSASPVADRGSGIERNGRFRGCRWLSERGWRERDVKRCDKHSPHQARRGLHLSTRGSFGPASRKRACPEEHSHLDDASRFGAPPGVHHRPACRRQRFRR